MRPNFINYFIFVISIILSHYLHATADFAKMHDGVSFLVQGKHGYFLSLSQDSAKPCVFKDLKTKKPLGKLEFTDHGWSISWEKTPLTIKEIESPLPLHLQSKNTITVHHLKSTHSISMEAKHLILGKGVVSTYFFQIRANKIYVSKNSLLQLIKGASVQAGTIHFIGNIDAPPEAKLHISASRFIGIDSEHLPQHVVLEGPDKVIARLPAKIQALTTKLIATEKSQITFGPRVKTKIDNWLSMGESLISTGMLAVRDLELQFPYDCSLLHIKARKFKILDGRGDFYIGNLTLDQEARIEVPQGRVTVANLQAPEGILKTVAGSIILLQSKVKEAELTATCEAFVGKTFAQKMHVISDSQVSTYDLEYNESHLHGKSVNIAGSMVGHGLGLTAVATHGTVDMGARFEGDVSLTAASGHNVSATGDFSKGRTVQITSQE